jgi:hypothetical protein
MGKTRFEALALFNPIFPVRGSPMSIGDGKDQDFTFADLINDAIRETPCAVALWVAGNVETGRLNRPECSIVLL